MPLRPRASPPQKLTAHPSKVRLAGEKSLTPYYLSLARSGVTPLRGVLFLSLPSDGSRVIFPRFRGFPLAAMWRGRRPPGIVFTETPREFHGKNRPPPSAIGLSCRPAHVPSHAVFE